MSEILREEKMTTKKWLRFDATARVRLDSILGLETCFSLSLLETPINFTRFAFSSVTSIGRTEKIS